MTRSCGHGDEPVGSIERGDLPGQCRTYQLLSFSSAEVMSQQYPARYTTIRSKTSLTVKEGGVEESRVFALTSCKFANKI